MRGEGRIISRATPSVSPVLTLIPKISAVTACQMRYRLFPPVGLTAPCYTFIISPVISPRSIFKHTSSSFAALSFLFFLLFFFFLPFPRSFATIPFPSPSPPSLHRSISLILSASALSSRDILAAAGSTANSVWTPRGGAGIYLACATSATQGSRPSITKSPRRASERRGLLTRLNFPKSSASQKRPNLRHPLASPNSAMCLFHPAYNLLIQSP